MARSAAVCAALVGVVLLAGCRPDTVQVSFRPEVGATYRYEVRVRSSSEIELEGSPPEQRQEEAVLTAEHTVLRAGRRGIRVRVVLEEAGGDTRRFVVVFDRGGQLEAVESIVGVPPEVLGSFGISEIFPAAAGAPPGRRLAPGDRWRIDDDVRLPDVDRPARLVGQGRLVELGVVGGDDVARITTDSRLTVVATRSSPAGAIDLEGVQRTEYRATHDLDDGAVRQASSTTVGQYTLEVRPPPDRAGDDPLPGRLSVRVESETRRLDG